MSDNRDPRYQEIHDWAPAMNRAFLSEGPLFVSMHVRIFALGLDEEVAARLLLSGWALHGLPPRHCNIERHRGGPIPQRDFADVATAAAKLLSKLEVIDREVLAFLAVEIERRHYSLPTLIDRIRLLEDAAADWANLTRRRPGRQANMTTARIVAMLVKQYEDLTGDRIGRSGASSSGSQQRLSGKGGKFITEWFELVDPLVKAGTLFRLLPSVQAALRKGSETLDYDVKWLKEAELKILNDAFQSQ